MACLTLALAKGRTLDDTIKLLEKSGITFPDLEEESRKLIFYDTEEQIKLIAVKAVDVPTYVEKGAADIGVSGKDNILEAQPEVYEMLDLKLGQCKFAVAGIKGDTLEKNRKLTIASKYPTVAKKHFERKGQAVETVKLNGSVELAPLIGLADFIVDIVETGNTIKENGLEVVEEIEDISTRLIVNKASYATKSADINSFIHKLQYSLEGSAI
ncbi:ATP phosphoribosyltransferase [Virgibacillus xinjiangensis]|uniref:ATP phosphoribosyltransferase n=1 Tax=Virgibacillus xinjiangensis TaxID=393090 RepID=A0ABV7CV58_9BACI